MSFFDFGEIFMTVMGILIILAIISVIIMVIVLCWRAILSRK